VKVEDAEELHALAKHLGVSPEEIISAVEKVGDSIATVRKELGIPEDPAEPVSQFKTWLRGRDRGSVSAFRFSKTVCHIQGITFLKVQTPWSHLSWRADCSP
jgi:hypothetical protein